MRLFLPYRTHYHEPLLTMPKVLEYLSKKGYVRTEAMLRKESEIQQPGADGRPVAQQPEAGLAKYTKAYGTWNSTCLFPSTGY